MSSDWKIKSDDSVDYLTTRGDYCLVCGCSSVGQSNMFLHMPDYPQDYMRNVQLSDSTMWRNDFADLYWYVSRPAQRLSLKQVFQKEMNVYSQMLRLMDSDPETDATLCPTCGFKMHMEYENSVSEVRFDVDSWNENLELNGPLAAALIWLQEEIGEMEDCVFDGQFTGSIDAVFDMLGIMILVLDFVHAEFGAHTLLLAYKSYEWEQIRRGRKVFTKHQVLILGLVHDITRECDNSNHGVHDFAGHGDNSPLLLEQAMSKPKRRALVIEIYARYLNHVRLQNGNG